MGLGEFAAQSLEKKRKKWRQKDIRHTSRVRIREGKEIDLLEGAPKGRGIVIEKRGVTAKQPNSGIRKCVSPETRVQLFDGCYTTIKELNGFWGNSVISSYNAVESKIEPTKLVDWFSVEEKDKAFEITTLETNRKLIASADHPIYTQRGKIDLGELKEGNKVIVLPGKPIKYIRSNKTVLTEEQLSKAIPEKAKKERIIKELKERE